MKMLGLGKHIPLAPQDGYAHVLLPAALLSAELSPL